jgi:hypothetical protein
MQNKNIFIPVVLLLPWRRRQIKKRGNCEEPIYNRRKIIQLYVVLDIEVTTLIYGWMKLLGAPLCITIW